MRILRNAISIIRIKPITILYLGSLVLLILLFEMFNPLYSIFSGYFNSANGNYSERLLYIAQVMVSEPIILILLGVTVLIFCLAVSITAAFLLPPFLGISNNLILYGRAREGEWQYSIKKYSFKTAIVMFGQSLFVFCYLFAAIYGSYPIVYMSLALKEQKAGYLAIISLWVIFILTYLCVLVIASMYSFTLYPTIVNKKKGILNDVRGICNKNFRKKFIKFSVFITVIIIVNVLILVIKASLIIIAFKVVLFIVLYIILLFLVYLLFIYLFYWHYEYINKEK